MKLSFFIPFLMYPLALICVAVSTLGHADTQLSLSATQLAQMQVQWAAVRPQFSGQSASYPAEVMLPPSQMRVVTPTQSGLITQLTVSVGDNVKRGQVIGQLRSPEWVSLQTRYLQAETQASLQAQALKRDQQLFQDGIIAQRRLQETQSAYATSLALLNEQTQTLQLGGMSRQQITQLARQRQLHAEQSLLAPLTGQVIEQHVEVGARVDITSPILTLAQTCPLWLMMQVPAELGATIQPGMAVTLPKLGLPAKVERVLRQLNKNNQSLQVRATVLQGCAQLSAGQIVDVALIQQVKSDGQPALTVPIAAVARQGEQAVVFVRSQTGVRITPVQVLAEQDQQVTLRGHLTAKDEIAVRGVAALKGHWLGLGQGGR